MDKVKLGIILVLGSVTVAVGVGLGVGLSRRPGYQFPVGCALSSPQKDAAVQLTNLFEHGIPREYGYRSCYVLGDGRGFTVGNIGFCTGAACDGEVAELLSRLQLTCPSLQTSSLPILKYQTPLKSNIEDAATSKYPAFCSDWDSSVAASPCLTQVQDDQRDLRYFTPSQALANSLGLRFALSRAVLYDTFVQHGAPGAEAVLKATAYRLAFGHSDQQEKEWLGAFLDSRYAELKRPRADNGAWAEAAPRALALKDLLARNQLSLASPLQMRWAGEDYTVKTGVRMPSDAANCAA